MKSTALKVIFICLSLTSLAQCGSDDALSGDVEVSFVPDNPYVVNADLTLNPGDDNEFTAEAPWFIFSSKVANNSSEQLQLVTFTFNITGFKNGVAVRQTTAIDPSITCEDAGGSGGRAYLAEIPAGDVYQAVSDGCDSGSIIDSAFERWYIHSLPEASNFNYEVEVVAEGWFQDDDDIPIERFNFTGYLTTQ